MASFTPYCTCGCDKGPAVGGISLSPGWALIAAPPECSRPSTFGLPPDPPLSVSSVPPSLPDPIPLLA
jgi:hypothetical protein